MKKFYLFSMGLVLSISMFAQTVTLTFTGRDANNNWMQLDSVTVTNLTRGWQETIYWPDTVLEMQVTTGIDDTPVGTCHGASLRLEQNTPNPFSGTTNVTLTTVDDGAVTLSVMDMNGRTVAATQTVETHGRASLQNGTHQFRITVANAGTFILVVRQNGHAAAIKMVSNGGGADNRIEYTGTVTATQTVVETYGRAALQNTQSPKLATTKPFNFGDLMEYVGYATINGNAEESQRITQQQGASQTFTLQFEAAQAQLATVTTAYVTGITMTQALAGGTVISDGGAAVIDRGVCWNTTGNPTIADNCLHIGSGMGNFSDTLTGLVQNTAYYVRAYAINTIGVSYGAAESFTTLDAPQDGNSCAGTPTVTDVDGNVYNTVQLGNQCWMRENLKTTKYADNTPIVQGSTTSTTVAHWYYPNNDSSNKQTYGLLYNWKAVMRNASSSVLNPSGVQGICPTGWHVPSDAEWTQLTDYVSSQSQYVCGTTSTYIAKSLASTTGWASTSTYTCAVGNTPSSNNATGFGALPAGYYYGSYNHLVYAADFWSSTENNSANAYNRNLYYNNAYVGRNSSLKYLAFSVRCLRD
ncbi:MAG: T9SS type A sorting domain-containing protein [Bacteroidales bacterium]|nr:T9SS type A sorting domain-containing protein [Bacteroidales bacterium]